MITDRERFIAIVDNDILHKSDAIILLEGDGFFRYKKAVSLFNDDWAPLLLFSGGITDYEYGSYPFQDILPLILKEGVPRDKIIHEDKSINTKEQAEEVINLALKYKWKRLILVATHDHQYRAYLTFLKVVLGKNTNTILFNAPARNLGWFSDSQWGKRINKLEQEFLRIEKYSKLGHLASFTEAILYQEWKEKSL